MDKDGALRLLADAGRLQSVLNDFSLPSETLRKPTHEPILQITIFASRGFYIQSLVNQINVTYSESCFDACAILLRKLLEVQIVEVFEHHGCDSEIKDTSGGYLRLSEMVTKLLGNRRWTVGKNATRGINNLKDLGDYSAHNRRYIARRKDIDRLYAEIRLITEELVHLAT